MLLAALDAILTDTDSELELTTAVEARDNNIEMIDTANTPNENMQIEEVTIGKPKRGPPVLIILNVNTVSKVSGITTKRHLSEPTFENALSSKRSC